MKSTTLRRSAALCAGAALALTGLTTTPAQADTSPSGAAAAAWLTGKTVDGQLFPEAYNNGFNIDAGFAQLSVSATAAVVAIRDALATSVKGYIAGEETGPFADPGSTYANATAKTLAFVVQSGGDPRSFGGVDLVSRLEAVASDSGATAGRIADVSVYGDYANTIGQAYAAEGLAAVGSAEAPAVRSFLLQQQCPNGQFRLSFAAAAAPEQRCVADPAGPTGPDVTAYVVLALQAQYADPTVRAAVDKAVAWLSATQRPDGSFTDEDGKPNSNSTGLAGAALGESCAVSAADRAAAWVRSLQVPPGQTGPLAAEVGAIAFGPAELAAAKDSGITDLAQWKVSTAQAAPALAWDPAAPATVQVSGPSGFVKGGKAARFTITGVAAGERVCVTDSRGRTVALTGTGSALVHEVATREKQNGLLTVSATTGPGRASDRVEVLGDERLRPRFRDTVEQGERAAVKVKSLGAREKVKVLVDGERVAKGRANRKGVFRDSFIARFAPGRHKLVVVGQFADRSGATTFRVVR